MTDYDAVNVFAKFRRRLQEIKGLDLDNLQRFLTCPVSNSEFRNTVLDITLVQTSARMLDGLCATILDDALMTLMLNRKDPTVHETKFQDYGDEQ